MKIFLFALLLVGCSHKRIEITSEYIINQNWSKRGEEIGANSIAIKRMTVKKDSIINPFSTLTQAALLEKLEIDSSFIYSANVKIKPNENYKDKRIYFNKDNGFYWWSNLGNNKVKDIGKLEVNTWYEISRINYFYYLVYVDSTEKIHRFIVNLANF